jgi:hypothetical protein
MLPVAVGHVNCLVGRRTKPLELLSEVNKTPIEEESYSLQRRYVIESDDLLLKTDFLFLFFLRVPVGTAAAGISPPICSFS